jgi:hypothetical protein
MAGAFDATRDIDDAGHHELEHGFHTSEPTMPSDMVDTICTMLRVNSSARRKFLFFGFAAIMSSSSALAQGTCSASSSDVLKIDLIRTGIDTVIDHGLSVTRIYGDIGVNNRNIGRFYENPEKRIPKGTYSGFLRYRSDHNFVQSSCGGLSHEGDFLLEVANVTGPNGKGRSNILFHPGYLPSHSAGCVLFGARRFDAQGTPLPLDDDNPLVIIRREFYGTDTPISCPDKSITITVSEN